MPVTTDRRVLFGAYHAWHVYLCICGSVRPSK